MRSIGDSVVQRRRKPRAKPRDVFSGSSSTPSKVTKNPPPRESKNPPAVPPSKPSILKKLQEIHPLMILIRPKTLVISGVTNQQILQKSFRIIFWATLGKP